MTTLPQQPSEVPHELLDDPKAPAYLNELAADIAAHGGFEGRDPTIVIAEAHARRQAFAAEVLANGTQRAAMAREVLQATVYGSLATRGAVEGALKRCEHLADAAFRRRVFGER